MEKYTEDFAQLINFNDKYKEFGNPGDQYTKSEILNKQYLRRWPRSSSSWTGEA